MTTEQQPAATPAAAKPQPPKTLAELRKRDAPVYAAAKKSVSKWDMPKTD